MMAAPQAPAAAEPASSEPMDLGDLVDTTSIECLNFKPDKSAQNIFPPSGDVLETDADDQLIVVVPFKSPVRLTSISFVAPDDARKPGPVKVFANKSINDFSLAEDSQATQEVNLDWTPAGSGRVTAKMDLKTVKFQNIHQITLFFAENAEGDGDVTALHAVTFTGFQKSETNVSNLKKC